MLSEREFQQNADAALGALYSRLAESSGHFDFDVDMNGGALSIEFEEPRERFVVSPNSPVRQIWVSAHVQSFKFDWSPESANFVLSSSGQTLEELLVQAIRRRIPEYELE